ncbi:MAG: penicillin acylase family protein [Balneolaceae bacterium]|nr:penicillin acylase family protein [Balneolaceae bacterium]
MAKKVSLFLSVLLLTAILILLSTPFGSVPPLGSFFHPIEGFWGNAEKRELTGSIDLNLEGLQEPVEIYYDERSVPHIFAQNDHDLYFAQGYVTARDRLFQMELQIRAAGGMLSEWLGPDLLEYDKNQRRLGMMYGAEQAMEGMLKDEIISSVIRSYSDGVNAYIKSLSEKDYPLEYKILNAEPVEWKPFNSALLLKYMSQMLAGRSEDVITSNTLAHFGEEFVNRFLSSRSSFVDPIIPNSKEWDFNPLQIDKPDSLYTPRYNDKIQLWQPDRLNGSNNWVVDGSKTAGGYPILSNDMHLNMTVPSIWYEIQLQTPTSNVYGVTLQGAPTVIVGFNENIAWGSTNTGADVMDWYEITFRDESKNEYLHDGEWLPVNERVETIEVKGEEAVHDTILFTHHGPVYESVRDIPLSRQIQNEMALRWMVHEPSNELLTFYKLNRAKNYKDFKEAFRTFQAPAQNMNYGGTDGNIAVQTGGQFPLKWKYQGRTVSDGSNSRYDWHEFIPYEQNPFSLNPERGFLSASNQYPTDESYPYYLGESFAPYERGKRINDQLRKMEDITVEDFKDLQMDNFSYHAFHLLPILLENIQHVDLSVQEQQIIENLQDWNYWNDGDKIEPSVFKEWWETLFHKIWSDEYDTHYPMRWPERDITLDLILEEPESSWFDNHQTPERETLPDLIIDSFRQSLDNLTEQYGTDTENWKWGFVNDTDFGHAGQIPGLGVPDIFTGGGDESVNAVRGSHGPSWRMIVELDPDGVRGYGVYPGGQSGNPGSKTYSEFVETWRTGELFELQFLREKPEISERFPLVIKME